MRRSEADLESQFQRQLIDELENMFPGCFILKNDANYLQGVPDLLVLYKSKWAMLEVKASESSRHQPNQDYYIDMLDDMSFAAFVSPENMVGVLNDLQSAFRTRRQTRVSVG